MAMETVSAVRVSFNLLFPIFESRYLCTDSRRSLNNTDGLWIMRLEHAVQMVTTRMKSGECEKVVDNKGKPRSPNGYHRIPDGDCERARD
jgi:hypothetical protein